MYNIGEEEREIRNKCEKNWKWETKVKWNEPKRMVRVHLDTAYFAENWKHYSKIIFKYVNSAMRPIFNKKVVEKWNL